MHHLPAVRPRPRLSIIALALLGAFGARAQQQPEPPPTFEDLLKQLAPAPGDACDFPDKDRDGIAFSDLEYQLFQQADKAIAQGLNEKSSAASTLEKLERLSAEINKRWSDERQFHYQVIDIAPAVLVKMTYRNRATFSFFAKTAADPWRTIGASHNHRTMATGGYESLDLFPLARGPSQHPRFLARFSDAGCGSGVSIGYYAYEWNPRSATETLDEFIKLEGAASQLEAIGESVYSPVDRDHSFMPVGELKTDGLQVTLPFCWFSAIDSYRNPSLCAANTYDISGDRVRFVSTVYNRPDLLPIAKAIEYAQAHDYPAVLAYCGSPAVARKLISDIPPFVFSSPSLDIKRMGPSRKTVTLGDTAFQFDVEKRGDRWLVVAFRIPNP
jgi:hypothetical protein